MENKVNQVGGFSLSVSRLNIWLNPTWTFFAPLKPLHLSSIPLSLPTSTHSSTCNSNSLGGANLGSEQKSTIHIDAGPFFQTRSTVNCVFCSAMQVHVDQGSHDRTRPVWGLFPKPTAAPTMPRGFHNLPLFSVGETKNHDPVVLYNISPASLLLKLLLSSVTQLFLWTMKSQWDVHSIGDLQESEFHLNDTIYNTHNFHFLCQKTLNSLHQI